LHGFTIACVDVVNAVAVKANVVAVTVANVIAKTVANAHVLAISAAAKREAVGLKKRNSQTSSLQEMI
jgi:hypothetical protein